MAAGLDQATLSETIHALREFAARRLPDQKLIELDTQDEFPEAIVREMCGAGLGIQLFFIPEAYGGMGAGAFDLYRICEQMARIDIGIATGVLATFLGSDPIRVGGTEAQKRRWMTKIAEDGALMAYGATEPAAGSDLGALRSVAVPVSQDGQLVGYKLSGAKQWISNGGVADVYTILAQAPGGPSWFVVERDAPGLGHGKPEDKHGIRASNTAALSLDEVYVDADRLIGGSEGKGLLQAQAVFGYTRLMVAAFGLGGGWAALDRAIAYSTTRIQAGGPLSEKQGYTHKLIVPHVARLEASRAFMEYVAERLDAGEEGLTTEGAIAKYLATESANRAADASIQALGGYGYTKEYMVEKVKRDVRITTIYEGTSEIMEMTISRDRWQLHLKTRGRHYQDEAQKLLALHATHPQVGADIAALGLRALATVLEHARVCRLTRHQHILLRLGELCVHAECAAVFCQRAARAADGTLAEKADRRFAPPALAALARIFAREAAELAGGAGLRWMWAASSSSADLLTLEAGVALPAIHRAQLGLLADMDLVANTLYDRAPAAPASPL